MDITNYIVQVAMTTSQVQTRQSIGIAVARKAMDVMDMQAQALGDMLSQPVSFGHQIDVRV